MINARFKNRPMRLHKSGIASQLAKLQISSTWITGLAVGLCCLALELWRLATQTGGNANLAELATKHQLYIDSPWWKSPEFIYGPYFTLLHGIYAIHHSLYFFRLTSVLIGLIVAMLVFWLANQYYGRRLALLTEAALITNIGFLISSRQASPLICQLLVPLALVATIYVVNNWDSYFSLLLFFVVSSISLYVPGALWLVIAAIVFCQRDIRDSLGELSLLRKLSIFAVWIVIAAPLGFRLIVHYSSSQLAYWLGYGLNGKLDALKHFGTNFYRVPLNLFIHSSDSSLTVGHLPLIPIAESLIILIGLYCYVTRLSNRKWQILLLFIGLSWIIAGFGVLSTYALLPLVILVLGAGLAYLLKQWYSVFPRNPIAKYGGLIIMSLVVLFSCLYAARSYFVAWANDPTVNASYSQRLH